MKHKYIFSTLLLVFVGIVIFIGVEAASLDYDGQCRSITIKSDQKVIETIVKEGIYLKQGGLKEDVFVDGGKNNAYHPGPLIPNNTYSYSVSTADGPKQCLFSYLCWSGARTRSLSAITHCPPVVSVRENLLKEDITPVVNMSNDSENIEFNISEVGQSYVILDLNIDSLNLGKYQKNTPLKKGYIRQWKTSYWWFGSHDSWWVRFYCTASSCLTIEAQQSEITPGKPYYSYLINNDYSIGDSPYYACGECQLNVYEVEPREEVISISTDNTYDILKNGQEIAINIPATKKTFLDYNLNLGTSYTYSVRAPSIYSREGINNIPTNYNNTGVFVESSNNILEEGPIQLPESSFKNIIIKTEGDFPKRASVILNIDIPNDSVGEYRTPGYVSQVQSSGRACLAINNNPSDCLWSWTPERIISVSADKTYDILRDGVEIASRISVSQKTYLDSDLLPGTTYEYIVRAPSIHSREGITNGSIGIPESPVLTETPTLASPVETVVKVTTLGERLVDPNKSIDEIVPELPGGNNKENNGDKSGADVTNEKDFGEDSREEVKP